ncbi:MAG: Hpt domain-containing protein, partial [Desulfobulbaceae bacterium]|nr:Hpt domain-containing protein [Desulfobulbaceae bacterium]
MTMTDLNDMSLLDLFLMETGNQSITLTHELSLWDSDHGGDGPNFTVMHRAVHSIAGAARIVDLQEIIDLTQAMEKGIRVASSHPTPEIRNLL